MYAVLPKFVVKSLSLQELVMCSVLYNLSIIYDVDLIDVLDGGEPVGDGDGGASNLSSVQSILNNLNK